MNTLSNELKEKGWTVTITGNTATCKSPSGIEFTVEGKGLEDNNNVSELERYFFNDNGTGKELIIEENEEIGILIFKDGESAIPNASTSIQFMNVEDGYMLVEYKGSDYKIAITESNVPTIGTNGKKVIKLENEVYAQGMTEDEIKIKQYFTGYSGEGKQIYATMDIEKSELANGPVFKDDSIISNASESIKIVGGGETNLIVKFNGLKYIIEFDDKYIVYNAYKYEKTYPIAYSNGGNVIIIELSENEAIHRICAKPVGVIEPVDDINKIEGHENDIVINEIGKNYSKVIKVERGVPAVYCEDEDSWYLVTASGSDYSGITQRINNGLTCTLDTTISKEELQQMIQDARDAMNNN